MAASAKGTTALVLSTESFVRRKKTKGAYNISADTLSEWVLAPNQKSYHRRSQRARGACFNSKITGREGIKKLPRSKWRSG